jgi:hypothetical protein
VSKCIPVRIDDKLASQLSTWADGRGVPLSHAIRDILSDFVADRVADAIARAAQRHAERTAEVALTTPKDPTP